MNIDSRFGVRITKGPMNWQVIQQEDGRADIRLEGSWYHPEEHRDGVRVYVRLYSERENLPVINSVLAEITEPAQWVCILKNVPAGGPYRIETLLQDGTEEIPFEWSCHGDMRHHVCVGDVFLIAGQSNGAGYGKDPLMTLRNRSAHAAERASGIWRHIRYDSTDTVFRHIRTALTRAIPYLAFARTMKRKHRWPMADHNRQGRCSSGPVRSPGQRRPLLQYAGDGTISGWEAPGRHLVSGSF